MGGGVISIIWSDGWETLHPQLNISGNAHAVNSSGGAWELGIHGINRSNVKSNVRDAGQDPPRQLLLVWDYNISI